MNRWNPHIDAAIQAHSKIAARAADQAPFGRRDARDVDLIVIAIMKDCSLYEAINWLDYGRPYEVTRP